MHVTPEQIMAAFDARLANPENAAKIGDKAAQDALRAQVLERINGLGDADLGTLLAAKGTTIEGVNDRPTAPTISREDMALAGLDVDKVDEVYEQAMAAPMPEVSEVPVAVYASPTPPKGPKHAAPDELAAARKRIAELERDAAVAAAEQSDQIEHDRIQADREAFVAKAKADLEAESVPRDTTAEFFDTFASINAGDVEESAGTEAGDPDTWTEPGEAYPGQNLDEETDADTAAALGAAAGEAYSEGFDPVQRPMHYNSHPSGVECNAIARHYSFNVGSAIKYLWRHGLKSNAPAAQDIRKAIKFLEFELENIEAAA